MKAHTDLEQSKKLAEILQPKSADMWWNTEKHYPEFVKTYHEYLGEQISPIPVWSLAALLDQLENVIYDEDGHEYQLQIIKEGLQYYLVYEGVDYVAYYDTPLFDDLIDCCYEMILILKENDLI